MLNDHQCDDVAASCGIVVEVDSILQINDVQPFRVLDRLDDVASLNDQVTNVLL